MIIYVATHPKYNPNNLENLFQITFNYSKDMYKFLNIFKTRLKESLSLFLKDNSINYKFYKVELEFNKLGIINSFNYTLLNEKQVKQLGILL